jgi:hypothetical protein
MSEPTKEETIGCLKCLVNSIKHNRPAFCKSKYKRKKDVPWSICANSFHIICRLIKQRPKVTKEVVEKWAERISDDSNLGRMHILYLIQEMLKEMGIKDKIPIFNEEGNSNEEKEDDEI